MRELSQRITDAIHGIANNIYQGYGAPAQERDLTDLVVLILEAAREDALNIVKNTCHIFPYSSRMCENGTKGCDVEHSKTK